MWLWCLLACGGSEPPAPAVTETFESAPEVGPKPGGSWTDGARPQTTARREVARGPHLSTLRGKLLLGDQLIHTLAEVTASPSPFLVLSMPADAPVAELGRVASHARTEGYEALHLVAEGERTEQAVDGKPAMAIPLVVLPVALTPTVGALEIRIEDHGLSVFDGEEPDVLPCTAEGCPTRADWPLDALRAALGDASKTPIVLDARAGTVQTVVDTLDAVRTAGATDVALR